MPNRPDIKAFLNCLRDPAILLDTEYRILAANEAYQATYGGAAPLRNRHCYAVSHGNSVPCDLAGEHCPLKQARLTGETAKVLHVHHTPRGQEYVNVETWPVKNDHGEVLHFIEVLKPSNIAQPELGTGLVGRSPAFRTMLGLVDRVAATETTVLLLGETGTGKEVIARTLHERSTRAGGPFVPVECAGLPETLFESELFGYVKGAFTGATSDKPGLVEAAEGGTLFLDEVGEISASEQVKLLRLLETHQFRRVGSTEPRQADFRLVCATNKSLAAMVRNGTFREDLYYRLNVFDIRLPPLRERREDLAALVETLLQRLGTKARFSPAALECLARYDFPGNVRELRNVVERAVLMCDGGTVQPEHLSAIVRDAAGTEPQLEASFELRTLEEVERDYLRGALARHKGDRRTLAETLGISERALYRKIAALKHSAG